VPSTSLAGKITTTHSLYRKGNLQIDPWVSVAQSVPQLVHPSDPYLVFHDCFYRPEITVKWHKQQVPYFMKKPGKKSSDRFEGLRTTKLYT